MGNPLYYHLHRSYYGHVGLTVKFFQSLLSNEEVKLEDVVYRPMRFLSRIVPSLSPLISSYMPATAIQSDGGSQSVDKKETAASVVPVLSSTGDQSSANPDALNGRRLGPMVRRRNANGSSSREVDSDGDV